MSGPKTKGCRPGWCAKEKAHYGGGYDDTAKGICPICKGKLERQDEPDQQLPETICEDGSIAK